MEDYIKILSIHDAGLKQVDDRFFAQDVIVTAFYPLLLTVQFPVSSAYIIKQKVTYWLCVNFLPWEGSEDSRGHANR